jgi:hypothetical protein
MSDSKDSFDSLTNPNTPGDDPLPPELEPLQQRVLQDSALWRASLPGTDVLTRQVTALSHRKLESRQLSYRIREELQMQDPTHTALPETAPTRPATVIPHAAHARATGLVAGGAALALVALFVAFFALLPHGGHSGKDGGLGPTHATATATTATRRSGQWQPVASLTHTAGMPVISPVNAKVVYEIANGTVRRSADGGATWANLPNPSDFPAGDTAQWMDLFVSPFSADTLWTTANLTHPNGAINCPVGYPTAYRGGTIAQGGGTLYEAAILLGGSIPCQVQNVSTDGGQTWKLVKLSFAFMLGSASPDAGVFNFYDQYSATPQIQGNQIQNNRMYTRTSDGPLASSASGGHVAMSSDGGATWQDASAQLTSAGLDICDVAAVGVGSTLFAVANANGCGLDGATAPSLWRSDDAGRHWHQVTLPPDRFVIRLIALGGPDQPTLYAQTASLSHSHAANTAALPTDIFASTNGGQTWKQAPSQGVLAGVIGSGPMTVIGADNGLVVPFFTQPNAANQLAYTFDKWDPGASAWVEMPHSALSLYGSAQLQQLPVPSASGDGIAIWLTVPRQLRPAEQHVQRRNLPAVVAIWRAAFTRSELVESYGVALTPLWGRARLESRARVSGGRSTMPAATAPA